MNRLTIFADGASRGNPGLSSIGALIRSDKGEAVARISQKIGRATNNQAEYRALITALEEAIRLGGEQVEIRMDSQLVVRQVRGQYRVKSPSIKPLYQQVITLLSKLTGFTITHIPRRQNQEADSLANKALDQTC